MVIAELPVFSKTELLLQIMQDKVIVNQYQEVDIVPLQTLEQGLLIQQEALIHHQGIIVVDQAIAQEALLHQDLLTLLLEAVLQADPCQHHRDRQAHHVVLRLQDRQVHQVPQVKRETR